MSVNMRAVIGVCLFLIMTNTVSCSRAGRKMGRAKHMFWFKVSMRPSCHSKCYQPQNCQVSESEKALCDNVEEGNIERGIVEGPPAAGCREDSERSNNISLLYFMKLHGQWKFFSKFVEQHSSSLRELSKLYSFKDTWVIFRKP